MIHRQFTKKEVEVLINRIKGLEEMNGKLTKLLHEAIDEIKKLRGDKTNEKS